MKQRWTGLLIAVSFCCSLTSVYAVRVASREVYMQTPNPDAPSRSCHNCGFDCREGRIVFETNETTSNKKEPLCVMDVECCCMTGYWNDALRIEDAPAKGWLYHWSQDHVKDYPGKVPCWTWCDSHRGQALGDTIGHGTITVKDDQTGTYDLYDFGVSPTRKPNWCINGVWQYDVSKTAK